jgi:hypothetical protein
MFSHLLYLRLYRQSFLENSINSSTVDTHLGSRNKLLRKHHKWFTEGGFHLSRNKWKVMALYNRQHTCYVWRKVVNNVPF